MSELTPVSSSPLTNRISFSSHGFLKTLNVGNLFVAHVGQQITFCISWCLPEPPLRLSLPKGTSHVLFMFESPNLASAWHTVIP